MVGVEGCATVVVVMVVGVRLDVDDETEGGGVWRRCKEGRWNGEAERLPLIRRGHT